MRAHIYRGFCGLAMLLAAMAVNPGMAQDAQHAQHAHETTGDLELQLDNGRRWGTDESLRTGMARIREAFERKRAGFHAGSLSDEDYLALADIVDIQLNFIFNNCELPPAADAQLHLLLASISGAAASLRGEGRREEGMRSLHRALGTYGTHFDHPGWPGHPDSPPD